jgi:SAM-dependent methyltransferase
VTSTRRPDYSLLSVDEPEAVRERYARRGNPERYSLLNVAALLAMQERQRMIADLFARIYHREVSRLRLLEVGCGTGGNLLELIRLGFTPDRLQGIELLSARAERARQVLPASVRIVSGDAAGSAGASVAPMSQDIVYQSTVFSSLLDDEFQERLADAMWQWVRPGGGILWYDFTVNNPSNADVRAVPLARIRRLFPNGEMRAQRLTLAPPIARAVTRIHPSLYAVFSTCRWLRTHVLVWIAKAQMSIQS